MNWTPVVGTFAGTLTLAATAAAPATALSGRAWVIDGDMIEVAEQGKPDVEHHFRPEAAGETIESAFLSLLTPSVDRNSARR